MVAAGAEWSICPTAGEGNAPHGIPPEGCATSQHRPQQWTHNSTGHAPPQTPPSLGGLVKAINKSTSTLPQQHLQIPDKDTCCFPRSPNLLQGTCNQKAMNFQKLPNRNQYLVCARFLNEKFCFALNLVNQNHLQDRTQEKPKPWHFTGKYSGILPQ